MTSNEISYQSRVFDPREMALIGHAAADAGLDGEATIAFISMLERAAFEAAQQAASQVAMKMWPDMLAQVRDVHQATVARCAAAVSGAHRGITTGFLTNHAPCIAAIRQVGNEPARRV